MIHHARLQCPAAPAGVVKLVDTADLDIEHQARESACVNPLKFGETPGRCPRQRRAKPNSGKV